MNQHELAAPRSSGFIVVAPYELCYHKGIMANMTYPKSPDNEDLATMSLSIICVNG